MKFKITFKDPDAVEDCIYEEIRQQVNELKLSDAEADAVCEVRIAETEKKLASWLKYGEYITVEFDLENMTATVLNQ